MIYRGLENGSSHRSKRVGGAAVPETVVLVAAVRRRIGDLAGEIGWSRMQEGDGNSTYRNRIIDAIFNMDGKTLDEGAKYEIR